MDPEAKIMSYPVLAKHENSATLPYRKIKVKSDISNILHLPDGQRIITHSWGESLQICDLETGTQVKEWEDEMDSIALSRDGKILASRSRDDSVKLWSIDTGKVIKTLTGHTKTIPVCWSPDGGRVLGRSVDGTFRVWDVKSGEIILGPIQTASDPEAEFMWHTSASYSPDGKMIATMGKCLEIWDANTGKLIKTLEGEFWCLAWSSNGKTLTAWDQLRANSLTGFQIMKFDTVTWTVLDVRKTVSHSFIHRIFISPDRRFFATTSHVTREVQLWSVETNQPIGTPLDHEHMVDSATFTPDGKFLITSCYYDHHICQWDVSAVLKEAGLPSPAPKMKGAPRIPPGFFDDALREANLRIRLSQSHGPPIPVPRQRTLSRFHSFWHRSKSHGETGHHTRPRSHPLSWTRNLVSGILRRRDGSDIELREVEVPYTAGKPRNYHARKKPTASSSRPPKIHATQSSQLPQDTTTSTHSAVTGTAEASGTPSRPHIICTGWRARFVGWLCCMPIQNADGHH